MTARRILGGAALVAALALLTVAAVTKCGPTTPCYITLTGGTSGSVFDVTTFGARADGTDAGPGTQAAYNTCIARHGGTIWVPNPGTGIPYKFDTHVVNSTGDDCTLECEAGAVLDCRFTTNSPGSAINNCFQFSNVKNNRIKNCKWLTAPSQAVVIIGVRDFEVSGNVVDESAGGTGSGGQPGRGAFVAGQAVNGLFVHSNKCTGDADGGCQCVSCVRDCNNVSVTDNDIMHCYNGINITSGTAGGEPSDYIFIQRNYCEPAWMDQRTRISNAGDAVTYTDATLVDSSGAVDFTVMGTSDTIRVLPVRVTSGAAATFPQANKIIDTSVNFRTAGVIMGDVIYPDLGTCLVDSTIACANDFECPSGTCEKVYAKVKSLEGTTIVWHFGFKNRRTFMAAPVPPPSATFKIHQLILGRKASATASTVTSDFFWHTYPLGQRVLPPKGALYEAAWDHPNYCIQFDAAAGVRKGQVNDNIILDPWSDGMTVGTAAAAPFNDFEIDGNFVTGSQDACITINGAGIIAKGNHLRNCGTYGFFATAAYSFLADNIVRGWMWTNFFGNIAAYTLAGNDLTLHHNKAINSGLCASGAAQGNACVDDSDCAASTCTLGAYALRGFDYFTTSGAKFDTNSSKGALVAGMRVNSTATNVVMTDNNFPDGETYVWPATVRIEGGTCTFADISTGKYANVAPGSWCECSDCVPSTIAPCTGSGFGAHFTKTATYNACSGPVIATTPTRSATPTPVVTATASKTPTPTFTGPTPTRTVSPTRTATPSPTPTPTLTPGTPTPTRTPTPTFTATPVG